MLLIFGVLWWMYGGYVWLANARTPSRTPERLLMLVGMAGFLIMALAIPDAFGQDGVALGVGVTLATDGSFELHLEYFDAHANTEVGFSSKLEALLGPRRTPGTDPAIDGAGLPRSPRRRRRLRRDRAPGRCRCPWHGPRARTAGR